MNLRKPPFPSVTDTAVYFWTHAGHRETAIDTAIEVIRDVDKREYAALADDPTWQAFTSHMGDWVIESLLQGAWMREYHEWEKATKAYFDGNHARNGSPKVDWRGKLPGMAGASHVDRVRTQLALFGATVPVAVLDKVGFMPVRAVPEMNRTLYRRLRTEVPASASSTPLVRERPDPGVGA